MDVSVCATLYVLYLFGTFIHFGTGIGLDVAYVTAHLLSI